MSGHGIWADWLVKVIMEEVGRGTTVDDGLAIAFAAVHHLLAVNKCRTMFATHFHDLVDMLGHDPATHKGRGPFSDVAFFCTDVDEVDVSSIFPAVPSFRLTWTYRICRIDTSPIRTA